MFAYADKQAEKKKSYKTQNTTPLAVKQPSWDVIQCNWGDMEHSGTPVTTGIEIEVRDATLPKGIENRLTLSKGVAPAKFKVESEGGSEALPPGIEIISSPLIPGEIPLFHKSAARYIKSINGTKPLSLRTVRDNYNADIGDDARYAGWKLESDNTDCPDLLIKPPALARAGTGGLMAQTNTAVKYDDLGETGALANFFSSTQIQCLETARTAAAAIGLPTPAAQPIRRRTAAPAPAAAAAPAPAPPILAGITASQKSLLTQIFFQAIVIGSHPTTEKGAKKTSVPDDDPIKKQHFDTLPKISTADVALYILTEAERGALFNALDAEGGIGNILKKFENETKKLKPYSSSETKLKFAKEYASNSLKILKFNLEKIIARHDDVLDRRLQNDFRQQVTSKADLDEIIASPARRDDNLLIHDSPRTTGIIKPYRGGAGVAEKAYFVLEQRRKGMKENEDHEKAILDLIKKR